MKKESSYFVIFAFLMLLFTGCAEPQLTIYQHGFLDGLAHGLTCPLSLISKLINDNYCVFASHNSGFTYYLGFGFGIFILIAILLFIIAIIDG